MDKNSRLRPTTLSNLAASLWPNAEDKSAGKQGRVMRFLLRMAFWLGVVLVLLPSGGSQPTPKPQVSAGEALWAAKVAVSDMRGFCERHHDACVVGSQAVATLGQRAQAGAKMLYEFLSDQFGPNDAGATRATGSVPLPAAKPSQNTLQPADLRPGWRGPQPLETASSS
jgi:Family of unknown function (DUF5330)